MSRTTGIIVLVVIAVVVAGGGYAGLASVKTSSSTSTSCTPPSACASTANDVVVFVPFGPGNGQTIASIAAERAIPATVQPSGSETVRTYSVAWGDGTTSSGSTPTATHSYASAGLYVISGSVTDTSGGVHTGTSGLFPVNANLSFSDVAAGTYPQISTTFSNGTAGGYEPWVAAGATVSVSGSYIAQPPTPGWTTGPLSITVGSGVVQKSYSPGATTASGSYTLTAVGIDNITLHGSSTDGLATLPFTYTWAVLVSSSASGLGCKFCQPSTAAKSPHPNSIVAYEVSPGGAITIDPAGDYYSAGYEVGESVFENLVGYNGSDVGPSYPNYIPQAAACVPGSLQCTSLFGSTLISGTYYTFPIAKTSRFYDPVANVNWSLYPTDVMFSMIRQMAFSDLPAAAIYPGWMVSQALLPAGNSAWDAGIHSPYNNTPQNILSSMLINDSKYCPTKAMTSANGCITFNVNGAGVSWPAFLSYLANGGAGSIVPASWYLAQGAIVPDWKASSADTPVKLPGGLTTTNTSAWTSYVASLGATSWDSYQEIGVSDYPTLEPSVAFTEVGSGPYYLKNANPAIGYVLEANPAYEQPSGCAGEPYCLPAPGAFAKTVTVYWEDTDTQGIQAAQAGQADALSSAIDLVGIAPSDTATMIALVQKGDLKMTASASDEVNTWSYNTAIDLSSLKTYDPYPINIQSNSLSFIGLRGFLDAAYPAASVQAEFNQIEGVQYGFNYGGFIPQYMGNYYPTNISWPNYNVTTGQFTDPVSNPSVAGSAGWYWQQLTTSGSPLYDSQFGSGGYSPSNPLHIPMIYDLGDPTHQSVLQLWSSLVSTLSHGAVVFDIFPVATATVFGNLLPNGLTPWPATFAIWFADYAQPYDYWAAFGAASGTYSAPDTLFPTFSQPQYNAASCGHSDETNVANLIYWANQPYIAQDCQGVAYQVAQHWAVVANSNLNLTQGAFEWNRISSIFNLLNIQADTEQVNAIQLVGPWVNPASANANSISGYPGGEELWWGFTGNGVA
jgi:hypothetical protein